MYYDSQGKLPQHVNDIDLNRTTLTNSANTCRIKSEHMIDPFELEILQESLLIAFAYNEEEHRFTIVTEHPERSPGSSRDLIALVFRDVNRFNREAGDVPKWARFKFRYALKDERGSIVFQDIATGDGNGGSQYVRFWFGPSFGGIAFEYRTVEVHRRGSRVVKVKDDFIYFDLVTMKEFDFYNPFPELL